MNKKNDQAGPVITLVADLVKKPRNENIAGRRFGKLTAIEIHHKHGTQYKWRCICDCGQEKIIFAHSLKCGDAKSCGCANQVEDLTGQTFTRWTVLRKDETRRTAHWICRCICNHESSVAHQNLKSGGSRSCGCLEYELTSKRATTHGHGGHGEKRTPTYRSWAAMICRCTNANQPNWKNYGGRGITVCDGWRKFENFLADMGERPIGKSVERVDNDDGYHCGKCEQCVVNKWKSNCTWATRREHGRNKRSNRWLELNGERKTISEWERHTGIHHMIIHRRIQNGWSVERALTKPTPTSQQLKPSLLSAT